MRSWERGKYVLIIVGMLMIGAQLHERLGREGGPPEPVASTQAIVAEPEIKLEVGSTYVLKRGFLACRSPESFRRMIELAADDEARLKAAFAAAATGECEPFEEGQTAYLEEIASRGLRVRRKGDLESFWTAYPLLRRAVQ